MDLAETATESPPSPAGTRRLTRVFEDQYDTVLAFAIRRTGSREEAEDVAAETFAIAARKPYEVPRKPKGWLLAVARKVLANHYRAEDRRRALVNRLHHEGPASGNTAGEEPALGDALLILAEEDRELLLLRYWDDLSGRELAQAFDCSQSAIYVRLHRARGRLARALTDSPEEVGS